MIAALALVMLTTNVNNMWADDDPIPFWILHPEGGNGGPGDDGGSGGNEPNPKSPILMPTVVQNGHTLYFYYGCDNTTLNLLDEDDEVVYTTEIDEGTTMLVLPEWLEGTFEIQIIRGSYTFVGEIEL